MERKIPDHVAIIMDGNGRWAKAQGMPRVFGHKKGAEQVNDIIEAAIELKIKVLTMFAFSEENWTRPSFEIRTIFSLIQAYLRKEKARLIEKNVCFRVIGNTSRLPKTLQSLLRDTVTATAHNDGLHLNIGLSYGSRSEITHACQKLAELAVAGKIRPQDITMDDVTEQLDTRDLPDPDLLIRTSGEQRISNFLLWQMAYTEFYFSPILWPDFNRAYFEAAIEAYKNRNRRFGGISEPASAETEPLQNAPDLRLVDDREIADGPL